MTLSDGSWVDEIPQLAAADLLAGVLGAGLLSPGPKSGEEAVFDPAEVAVWLDDDEPDFAFLVVDGRCVLRVHRDRFGTATEGAQRG